MTADRYEAQIKPVFHSTPEGRLALIVLPSMQTVGKKVDEYLVEWRRERAEKDPRLMNNDYVRDSFLLKADTPRFGSGEGKGSIRESVRGDDLYIMVDVTNYSLTYKMSGFENVMSPDDHFQDLKRVIAAAGRKPRRVNVIMPYLYEGRQIKQNGRESLDCSGALQELENLGVDNILTFDAHDARVQNAIPMAGFETVTPTYQFIKNVLRCAPDLKIDSDHLMVISPDEGGMGRAIYLANVLGVDMGMFFKRKDYNILKDGRNPVLAHEFLGSEVAGKDIIVIDDMISSGAGVLETAELLKKRKAGRIFICSTFGILTGGTQPFDAAYKKKLFDKLITTNLVYQPEELLDKPYYRSCDMSKYLALLIDTLNHDVSLSTLLNPIDRIKKVLSKHAEGIAV